MIEVGRSELSLEFLHESVEVGTKSVWFTVQVGATFVLCGVLRHEQVFAYIAAAAPA